MNKRLFVILTVLVIAISLTAFISGQAIARSTVTREWEYAVLTYAREGNLAVFEERVTDVDTISGVVNAGTSGIVPALNYIGGLGYEMVEIQLINNNTGWVVTFKREIPA